MCYSKPRSTLTRQISSECVHCVGFLWPKKPQLLAFGGLLYQPPFTDEGQIWCATANQGLHLHAKFHLNVFNVSAFGGQKPQFWANFAFFGAPVPTPFTDADQTWCAIVDPRYTLTCQISSRSVYSVTLCWQPPNFCHFLDFGI